MSTQPSPVTLPARVAELFSESLRRRLLALRQDLHRFPELAFEEHRTAERLEAELRELEPLEITRVAGTGVVARLKGRDPQAPVVALRGDIDALPVEEETGLPFASEHPGVMHACGHDVHASWTVGAACLLAAQPAAGDVLIVLQPAEEVGRGAQAILDTGILNDAAVIFGGHVDRRFPVGQVVADEGLLAASSDMFEIELLGKGAHGARPHESADPIVGGAALVGALQTIVSRRLEPGQPGVVSIGTFNAGRAANVIPERAHLTGTLRATSPKNRELLRSELERISHSTAAVYRLTARLVFQAGTPPILNPPQATAWARQGAASLLGDDAIVPLGLLNMAGEDFAYYMESIPGCFLRIGAREPDGEVIPAHSPRFYAVDETVLVGAAVLAEAARVASRALAQG